MKSVVLIGSTPKPRTNKRISLLKRISNVNLLCWDRMNESQLNLNEDIDYPVFIEHIKAVNDPAKRIFPYFKFYKKALKRLKKIAPDIIHVEGLDMLKIAEHYRRKSNKKVIVIYEVPDLRRLITEPQKGIVRNVLKKYVCSQEIKLCKMADLIIITSKMYYEKHYNQFLDCSKFIYIPNVPDYRIFQKFQRHEKDDNLTIGWIGSIRYKKQMKNLLEAAKITDSKLLIAGYEFEPKEIGPLCENQPNIEWFGMYNYEKDVASLYSKVDLIYAVYDTTKINEQIALPNKLYEAVYCKLPIIVSNGTYLAQVVDEWGVGCAVDCNDLEELIGAIEKMKSSSEYIKYQTKCEEHEKDINLEYFHNELLSRIRSQID